MLAAAARLPHTLIASGTADCISTVVIFSYKSIFPIQYKSAYILVYLQVGRSDIPVINHHCYRGVPSVLDALHTLVSVAVRPVFAAPEAGVKVIRAKFLVRREPPLVYVSPAEAEAFPVG